jgi:hypothetical protein
MDIFNLKLIKMSNAAQEHTTLDMSLSNQLSCAVQKKKTNLAASNMFLKPN